MHHSRRLQVHVLTAPERVSLLYYQQVQAEASDSLQALEKVPVLPVAVASSALTEQWWL